MGPAVGASLAMALGIAICPVPIILAVVLATGTPRVRASVYALGFLAGVGAVGAVALLVVAPAASASGPSSGIAWGQLALAAVLVAVAVRQLRRRPAPGEEAPMPRWLRAVDTMGVAASAGVGALMAVANPKNLLLALGGAAEIAQADVPGATQALAYAVFALIATLGVAAPAVVAAVAPTRSDALLGGLRAWLTRHDAALVAVICLLMAAKLLGDALSALST